MTIAGEDLSSLQWDCMTLGALSSSCLFALIKKASFYFAYTHTLLTLISGLEYTLEQEEC